MTQHHPGPPRLTARAYDHPDAQLLLHRLHDEQRQLYGFADHPNDTPPADYTTPSGHFLVADLDSRPAACGGWRRRDTTTAEIKRMYVLPELRGHGLGHLILRHLEDHALSAGMERIVLETGRDNRSALRLYLTNGYAPTAPYVDGRDPTINRALHKLLGRA